MNLSASLERVLTTGGTHWMGVQRYNVVGVARPASPLDRRVLIEPSRAEQPGNLVRLGTGLITGRRIRGGVPED